MILQKTKSDIIIKFDEDKLVIICDQHHCSIRILFFCQVISFKRAQSPFRSPTCAITFHFLISPRRCISTIPILWICSIPIFPTIFAISISYTSGLWKYVAKTNPISVFLLANFHSTTTTSYCPNPATKSTAKSVQSNWNYFS